MKRAFAVAAGLCLAAGCASLVGIKNNYHAGHHPDAGGSGGAATGGAGAGGSAGQGQQDGGGAGGSAGAGCVDTDAGTTAITVATMKYEQPGGIAVDCSGVYWTSYSPGTDTGSVMRMPPGGGTPQQLVSGEHPFGIALDDRYVYWTDVGVGALERTDKTQQHTTKVLASGNSEGYPSGIAVHNNYVYWTAFSSDQVYRMSTVSFQNVEAIAGHNEPNGIAVDGTRVVWGTAHGVVSAPLADLDGGTNLNTDTASAVALGNGHVFWIDPSQDAGAVGWSLVDGGQITRRHGPVVTSVHPPPWGIATDGQYAYWTNSADGTVNKLSVSGANQLLASGTNPAGICVFGDSVYWTNAGKPAGDAGYSDASVMRIHK